MPTKFSSVYERALSKFEDYSFLSGVQDIKEMILQNYLLSSVTDFQHSCKVDLTDYDLEKKQFNKELNNEIIEILSLGISYYWLSTQMLNSRNLKNRIHKKDFTSYSPANLLKECRELKDSIEQEYKGKIRTYSLRNGGIKSLKV